MSHINWTVMSVYQWCVCVCVCVCVCFRRRRAEVTGRCSTVTRSYWDTPTAGWCVFLWRHVCVCVCVRESESVCVFTCRCVSLSSISAVWLRLTRPPINWRLMWGFRKTRLVMSLPVYVPWTNVLQKLINISLYFELCCIFMLVFLYVFLEQSYPGAIISSTAIFVALDNNTLYESKWSFFCYDKNH